MRQCQYCNKEYANKKNLTRHRRKCVEMKRIINDGSTSNRYTIKDVPQSVLRIMEEEFIKAIFLHRCLHATIIFAEELKRFNIKTDVCYGSLITTAYDMIVVDRTLHMWNEIDGRVYDPCRKLILEISPNWLVSKYAKDDTNCTIVCDKLLPVIKSYKTCGKLLEKEEDIWDSESLRLKTIIHKRVTKILNRYPNI